MSWRPRESVSWFNRDPTIEFSDDEGEVNPSDIKARSNSFDAVTGKPMDLSSNRSFCLPPPRVVSKLY